jgi:peroxiredoxin
MAAGSGLRFAAQILEQDGGQVPFGIGGDDDHDHLAFVFGPLGDFDGGVDRAVPPELARPTPLRPVRADPAPDFRLPDVDGREISRSGQRGRITLLNFWGTWCPPCLEEVPDLVKLDAFYKERGVDLIGIALAEKNGAAGLRKWTRMHGMEYRQALADDAVLEAFDDIEEVPVSVLLDGAGQIRYRWDGERDFNTFRAAIDRLLAEEAKQ